jgi:competence protein ComEC
MASGTVQLVTWPVMAWHYYELPLYGLLLNLLVLPLMSLLFGTLLGAIAVGALCRGLGWNMMPARACIRPAHWIMALYRAACRWTSRLPGHMLITGRPYTWQMVLYGGLVLIFAAALMGLGAVRERRLEHPRPQVHERTGMLKKPYGRWVLFLIIWCGLLLLMPRLLVRHQTGDLTVAVMDVGQGDCIFLQWQGHALVIDGGSSSVSGVGTYRIEPLLLYYGVSRVDGWLLTHPDQDHVNGFLELVEDGTDIDICQVLAPAAGSDGESWETIREALKAADIPMNLLTAGMELASGAFYMECLYPEAEERFTDSNDLCTVLRVEYGDFSMLLTGDISSEIEALLCERYQETPEKLSCDLLKVAHHGSKHSSSENFLLMTKASYGVISCGKNNYGHPSEEALTRLREAGIVPYITLEEGALVLTISGDV